MSRRDLVSEQDMRQRMSRAIRGRRLALSLTVEQAAQRVGMHRRQWQKVEAGERNMTVMTLGRVGLALEIDPCELTRERPPKGSVTSGTGKP